MLNRCASKQIKFHSEAIKNFFSSFYPLIWTVAHNDNELKLSFMSFIFRTKITKLEVSRFAEIFQEVSINPSNQFSIGKKKERDSISTIEPNKVHNNLIWTLLLRQWKMRRIKGDSTKRNTIFGIECSQQHISFINAFHYFAFLLRINFQWITIRLKWKQI